MRLPPLGTHSSQKVTGPRKRSPPYPGAESVGLPPVPVTIVGVAPTSCWCIRSSPSQEGI